MPFYTDSFHPIYNSVVTLIAFIGFFRSIQVWMIWKKMSATSQNIRERACTSELFIKKNWNITFLVGTCLSLGILVRLVGISLAIDGSDIIADILGLLALVFVVALVNQWYALTCK